MRAVLLFLGLILLSAGACAHEGRPVYIKLTQTTPLEYNLQWKTPPVMASGLEPGVRLRTEGCERTLGDNRRRLSGNHDYRCNALTIPLVVQLNYPEDNPALSTLIVVQRLNGEQSQHFFGPETLLIALPAESSFTDVVWQYLSAGVEHILIGYDHLLFVLCLLLIAGSIRRLLFTVTGFTLGHSLTLALASFDILRPPIAFVEILIALSILILAAEIVKNNRHTLTWRYPIATATAFGLLHGFGFASVLGELGLPHGMKMTALVFFNIGIELGQIIFILLCLLLSQLLLRRLFSVRQARASFATWAIYPVGIVSGFWLVERGIGIFY